MNILALDSATQVLSVCLRVGEQQYTSTRDIGLKHSRTLMPLVEGIMREAGISSADLDLVACTRGPGSFTGLRIGMATAKGIAAAMVDDTGTSAPIVSVPTLGVYGHGCGALELVLPVIDGRKGRFYAAVFSHGKRLTEDMDLAPEAVLERLADVRSGLSKSAAETGTPVVITGPHAREFAAAVDGQRMMVDPNARSGYTNSLVELALERFEDKGADPAGTGPVYLRGSDAELSRKRL